mgnify:CR=1 FL=1
MPDSLFKRRWFSTRVFHGVNAMLHGREQEAHGVEASLMNQLMLELLDRQRAGSLHNIELYDFYAFCQQRLSVSHSQILQDLWVLYMLNEKREGYFVEFGACDGKLLSNTLLLEKQYGWKGILAEPNPVWHSALAENRACHVSSKCVFSHSGDIKAFENVVSRPELSRMVDVIPDDVHEKNGNRAEKQTVEVDTVSLLDLLAQYDAPKVVDYLSIDTEGSEFEILKCFDFDAYRFRLVSVEHAGESDKRDSICSLLEENGYERWRPELTRWDDWYVDKSI